MRLELHPLAHSDISRIVDHYKRAGGTDLADDFCSELRSFFDKAANSPEGYAIKERDIRRVNLEKISLSFSISHCRRPRADLGGSPPSQTAFAGDASTLR